MILCVFLLCVQPDMSKMMKLVDLAGAPSEFTHYVYWKRQRMVKVSQTSGFLQHNHDALTQLLCYSMHQKSHVYFMDRCW